MTLPSATTRLVDASGGIATGADLLTIFAPVTTLADMTPRLYSSADSCEDSHGYSEGLETLAVFIAHTSLPALFAPLPIDTAGTVGRKDTSGNTGTCVVDVAVGANGSLAKVDGILKVDTGGGGTIGTSQIKLLLSLDAGFTYKKVRLGTANSYVIPRIGQTLSFAAGTLTAGDTVLTWSSTAPKAASADIATAKTALAAQSKQSRTWLLVGDCSLDTDGWLSGFKTAVDGYETTDERYIQGLASIRPRLPFAELSSTVVRMTGSPNITFAEVGATGDTITRSAGSFISDGFLAGDYITVAGSALGNNFTRKKITNVAALVLTLDDQDLAAEGPVAGITITGTTGIEFAEVGATGDTITRNRGSWLDDGFRDADNITISGTVSNDATTTAGLASVTALVITLDTDDLVTEGIGADQIALTTGPTAAVDVAAMDAEFAPITSDSRVELSYGHARYMSPVLGYKLRYPASLVDVCRSFQIDLSETTWNKDDGAMDNWTLTDVDGLPYEFDERTTGGAEAAGFTCLRTWASDATGGVYVAVSQTREGGSGVLNQSHYARVANLAQAVIQGVTENFVGNVLVTKPPTETGAKYATTAELAKLKRKVDGELERYLGGNTRRGKGPRASQAYWDPATDDDLGVVGATLHGTATLNVLGTIFHVATEVQVR